MTRAISEAYDKGYLNGGLVQVETGDCYRVYFIDPFRLKQDLEAVSELGRPYVAELGMVVLPEITLESINGVLGHLLADGFFDNLKPVKCND